MKKKPKKDSFLLNLQRESAKAQGFYDGRFRQRAIEDKKKKTSKNYCRNFKLN